MVEVLSQTEHTARKEHTCSWCEATILPGMRYARGTQVSLDYGFETWKACRPCDELTKVVGEWSDFDEGISTEDLDQWADEFRDDEELGELARAYLARRGLDQVPGQLQLTDGGE